MTTQDQISNEQSSNDTNPATAPDKQEGGGYTHKTEQKEVNREQETMHNERDEDALNRDKEPNPPRETELDTEDAEREAGSASLWYRNSKGGTTGEEAPNPMR